MNQKPIRAEDAAILEELNNAVNTATEARRSRGGAKRNQDCFEGVSDDRR